MSTVQTEQNVIPAGTWNVDPVHTAIEFRVTDTSDLISTITGRFLDFEGVIDADDNLDATTITGIVRTASVSTDNEQRDQHLRSADFFDADTYPEIRFRSQRIVDQAGKLRVGGELTIKDTPFPVELDAAVQGTGTDRWGNERVNLEARGSFDWDTTRVAVSIDASAVKESQTA